MKEDAGFPSQTETPPFVILEHTADIGLRAEARSMEELFRNACLGMAEILGVRCGDTGRAAASPAAPSARHGIHLEAPADTEALLVDWLSEVLVLLEGRPVCLSGVSVERVDAAGMSADLWLREGTDRPEGTELKAVTYHQLAIESAADGYRATVFFDV